MAKVIILNCAKNASSENPKFEVSNVDVNDLVCNLKEKVSAEIDCPTGEIDFLYAGQCMKNDQTLVSYGVKNGSTVYALQSASSHNNSKPIQSSLDDISVAKAMHTIRMAIRNPSFRSKISNLKKNDVLSNIISTTPGLAQDHIASNFLQDPELLMQLTDKTTMVRVIKAHPCLAEAIHHIAAAVQDRAAPSSASGFSYSLNGLSEDEDETEETAPRPRFLIVPRNGSGAAITSAQLASALASVAATGGSDSGQSSTSSGGTNVQASSSGTGSQSVITTDMFSEAMQHALSAASPAQSPTSNAQAQLEQLRAMGITDDAVSLNALEMTGGNVQAALELIFGDFPDAERSDSH